MKYTVALLFLLVASSAAQRPGGRREAEEQRPGGRREAEEQRPGGRREVKCGPVCAVFCPFGMVQDANGCPTCACNPPPFGDLLCNPTPCKNCFYGELHYIENNCKRCRCKTLAEAISGLLG